MRTQLRNRRQPGLGQYVSLGVIWTGIAALCGGLGAAAMATINQPPDPLTLCRAGRAFAASTMVLIDTTDTLTENDRRRLMATVAAEEDRLRPGGKLTILTINVNEPGQPYESVSLCNPGKASDADPLFTTVSRIDEAWTKDFAEPISRAVEHSLVGVATASSPIIRTITAAITRPDFDARITNRRLVIVSDMLENQPGVYSQLKGGDFWAQYQRSVVAGNEGPDLRGVSVTIDYLAREKFAALQGEVHRRFWMKFFDATGAKSTEFVGLHMESVAPSMDVAADKSPLKPPVVHKQKKEKRP